MDLHDGICIGREQDNIVKADGESPKVSDKKINKMQLRRTTKLKRQEFGERM